MEIAFILIRNFESLYLTHNIIDFETTKLDFSYPWILEIFRVFHFFSIVINIYKKEHEKEGPLKDQWYTKFAQNKDR